MRGSVWFGFGLYFASLGCFMASLACPCYVVTNPEKSILGRPLLILGWLGSLLGEMAWWGNPIWFGAVGTMGHRLLQYVGLLKISKEKIIAGTIVLEFFSTVVGLILALTFAFQATTSVGTKPAGTSSERQSLEVGYSLWIGSFLLLLGCQVLIAQKQILNSCNDP